MSVLIESAIRAVLLALAAFAVLRLTRVTAAAARHAVWTVVLAGMVILPVWTLWGPRAGIPIMAPRPLAAPSAVVPAPVMWTSAATPAHTGTPRSFPAVPIGITSRQHAPVSDAIPWRTVALIAYAIGVASLLLRLIVGTLRAQHLIRHAVQRAGVLTSSACSAPVTVGWIRPVVILPEQWESWSGAQREAVLLHEQAHARRRDPLIQWIALANRAVFWFHPLAWWLERHLAELAEEACDAAVLSKGHRPADYCEYLLSMARTVTGAGARVNVIGAAMPGAFLSRRIGRILGAAPDSPLSARRLTLTLAACALLSSAVIAATFVPAAERPRMVKHIDAPRLPEFWFDDDEWHLETAPLMSAQEAESYRALHTVAERDAFIADFWQRRDPTAGTPANEFRREFERRIRYAAANFADSESAATFGYQTDRGRWYVTAGQPDAVRVVGDRSVNNNGVSRWTEEWDYESLDDLGSKVTIRFDVGSYFGCSWRGGKYRIVSPGPLSRFEGETTAPSGRRPFAQTYPGRFVYLSFPIDEQAVSMKWGLRTGRDGQIVLNEETGPVDYVQGQFLDPFDDPNRNGTTPVRPLLSHIQGLQLFETNGIACTEQLPSGTYTLRIESRLMNRAVRADSVTFNVN